MRTLIAMLLIVSIALMGCAASQEEVMSYHQTTQWTNEAILESVKEQAKDNGAARTQSMVHFSAAMTEASKTEDPTDNAVIAFAWGFATATPHTIEVPKLQYPTKPDSSVDALRAWTPIVGMAIPLLSPFLYGWASDNDGASQSIVADNGGTVVLESGNAGAYKSTIGGDNNANTTQSDWRIIDQNNGSSGSEVDGECPAGLVLRLSTGSCITPECEAIIDAGGSDSCDGGVGIAGGGETCDVTGGYLGPDGRIYADPGFTCSCSSRAAGNC